MRKTQTQEIRRERLGQRLGKRGHGRGQRREDWSEGETERLGGALLKGSIEAGTVRLLGVRLEDSQEGYSEKEWMGAKRKREMV